jgi:hypothetical protein
MASCGIAAGAKATLERALKEHPTGNPLNSGRPAASAFVKKSLW